MESSVSNSEIILHILLSVGVIVIAAKFIGVLTKKVGIPQVVGMILAGLLLRFIPWFHNFGGVDYVFCWFGYKFKVTSKIWY